VNGPWWMVLLAGLAGAAAGWASGVVVAHELGAVRTVDRVALTAGSAVGWAAATAHLGLTWSLPAVLYLVVLAAALTVIDLRAHRLPNRLVLGSYPMVGGLLVLAVADDRSWTSPLVAAAWGAALFAFFLLVATTGPLGGGDIKLAGLVGAYLGWAGGGGAVVLGVVVTVVSAAVVAGIGLSLRRMRRDSHLAYGPFLMLGCLIGVAVTVA